MIVELSILFAIGGPASACHAIDSDYILARDIAAVVPAFAQLPGDFNFGSVPSSGAPRILRGIELQRIAKNRGIDLDGLPDVCFQKPTFVPTAEQIRSAIQIGLGIDGAKIDVTSWSQHPAPVGELVFPRSGVQYSAAQPDLVWHGYVHSAGNRDFPVWAKTRITAALTRVVAVANLPAGKLIQENQVRLESCEDSPFDETIARNLDEVVGYVPKTSLRAKMPIRKIQVERPPDVARGDLVRVQVSAGAAQLVLEGRAETSGVKGSFIVVRNPSSGKDFRAQVTGNNSVTVLPVSPFGEQVQ